MDFLFFLANQLLESSIILDRKHDNDPEKLTMVCSEGFEVVKAAENLLKETPNEDKAKQVKELEITIKTAIKNA
jgi:hypothetical protein